MQNDLFKFLEANPNLSEILTLFLGLVSSFLITRLLIPEIIKISDAYNLHDQPNSRKIHTQKIPTFGGVAIFVGFIISTIVWAFSHHISNIQYLIGAIIIIVVVGMRDDFLSLRANLKLLGQSGASFLIMLFGETRFLSLHGFLGINELPVFWSFLVTWFTIIVITNAFNLIDGINGLAGTVALIVFGFYGTWFFYYENHIMTVLCFSLFGAVLGFLKYNYQGKIFMGDTGSLLLGFLAAATTIIFINENAHQVHGSFHFTNSISIASAVLVYPLFDTIRVFVIRLSEKRSPFSADRNHIHHWLLRAGFSHLQATFLVCGVTLGFLGFGFVSNGFSDNYLIPFIILIAFLVVHFLVKKTKEKEFKNLKK